MDNSRRTFLRRTAGLSAIGLSGLAGCSGSDGGGGSTATASDSDSGGGATDTPEKQTAADERVVTGSELDEFEQ